jgi:hypothetical protein
MPTLERKPRTSYRAKNAAKELVANGGTLKHALVKAGYSERTARTPSKVTDTQAFQSEIKPVLIQYEKIRDNILKDLEARDTSEEAYAVLALSLKNLTHDIQLLSGNRTENVGIEEERRTLQAILLEIRKI